jgi:hypothetical protein
MANFGEAFERTIAHETWRWSNRSTDAGGETYAGFSRVHHPDLRIWSLIDEAKEDSRFPDNLRSPDWQDRLTPLVIEAYRDRFWDRIRGDSIPSQVLANELFDQAVNRGVEPAVEDLQRALNYHSGADGHWRGGWWAPVGVDGVVGARETIPAIAKAMRGHRELQVVATHKSIREADLVTLSERRVTDRSNAGGWTNRIWGTWLGAMREEASR